jgi:D-inositol-3-phosphate glycosyltransferase
VRILCVSHYAPPHIGGLEAQFDALASRLARMGHDVVGVSSTAGLRDGLGVARSKPPEYRMIHVPALNRFFESRLGVPYPLFSPTLVPVLRREIANADVVHVHGYLFQSSVAALALAGRARHRPVTVLTEHVGYVPYENRLLDRLEAAAIETIGRWSARVSDAVVVYNANVRDMVARLAPRARIVWIDTAVDTDFFRPPADGERARLRAELGWDDRPRVLFGGRAVAKKGLGVALEAARVADGAFTLAVVGTMQPPPGAPHVERLGLLSRDRMSEVLRAADAVLVPSRAEGLPVTIQEGLASGLPVVATDDPGYRATLARFDAVRLMPADGAAMGAALARIVVDPQARAAAQTAVELARASFSLDAYASKHEQLFNDLLGRRPEGGSTTDASSRELEAAR